VECWPVYEDGPGTNRSAAGVEEPVAEEGEATVKPALISCLTCAAPDRPAEFMARCRQYVGRFTDVEVEHLVETGPSMAHNLQALLQRAEGEYLAIIEDDDWYSPDYLSHMMRCLGDDGAVGLDPTTYYHLPESRFVVLPHPGRSSLFTLVGRTDFLRPHLEAVIRESADPHIDIRLWPRLGVKSGTVLAFGAIGIKHGWGLCYGLGHSCDPRLPWRADPGGRWLRRMIGAADAEFYAGLVRKFTARPPETPGSADDARLGRLALQAGRDEDAVEFLSRAAEHTPDQAGLHADLAAALQNLDRNEAALESVSRALALDPGNVAALNTRGNALRALDRLDEALASFERAAELGPRVAIVQLNLADALHGAGRIEAAAQACERAVLLAPDHADAHTRLGALRRSLGNHEGALHSLIRAIELRPASAEAHNTMGNVLLDLGDGAAAEGSYRRALELEPGSRGARYNLGCLLHSAGRFDEARESFAAVVAIAPRFVDAHVRLALACTELARLEEAAEHFGHAVALAPELADARIGLGNVLRLLGRPEAAAASYRAAIALDPEGVEGYCNLAKVLFDEGRLEESIAESRRALAIQPDLAEAHWNLAQTHLARGEFTAGWREYEYRLLRHSAAELAFPQPPWQGDALAGRTIFVTAEQGVGDEIMFASCLPDVARSAGRCVVECDARLVPLFERSFPGVLAIARLAAPGDYPPGAPPADCRIAIGSLPGFYRPDLSSFPQRIGYLVPDPEKVASWRERLAALGSGPRVGISWRGGKEALVRRARTIPLSRWKRLAEIEGVSLINLQYGDCAAEIAAARGAGLEVHDRDDVDPLAELDDFAALVAALDLVLSVDNATVHLAGALGVPTWVLLPYTADWRWMEGRENSPWYPALRLFRQPHPGDWDAVFERVVAEWAGSRATGVRREASKPVDGG
jgi:tetratricopeptide (TPR) repeat protein